MKKLYVALILNILLGMVYSKATTTAPATSSESSSLEPTTLPSTSSSSSTTSIPTESSTESTKTSTVITESTITSTIITESTTTSTTMIPTSISPTTVPTMIPTSISPTTFPITSTVKPIPEVGNWTVKEANITCIRIKMAAVFNIPFMGNFSLLPTASSDKSDCLLSNTTQILVLENCLQDNNGIFTMVFEKDKQNFYVKNMTLTYKLDDEIVTVFNSDKLFNAKLGNSYLCTVTTNVKLENVTMQVSQLQVQAFGTDDKSNFGTAEECEADNTVSDVVPIAVGCALAALIIVVLIAYLIGRRRSRQKGYQSV